MAQSDQKKSDALKGAGNREKTVGEKYRDDLAMAISRLFAGVVTPEKDRSLRYILSLSKKDLAVYNDMLGQMLKDFEQ